MTNLWCLPFCAVWAGVEAQNRGRMLYVYTVQLIVLGAREVFSNGLTLHCQLHDVRLQLATCGLYSVWAGPRKSTQHKQALP